MINGYVEASHNIPLREIEECILSCNSSKTPPKDIPIYLHCNSGGRAMIACSILSKYGYSNHFNIEGGFYEIQKNTSLQLKNLSM